MCLLFEDTLLINRKGKGDKLVNIDELLIRQLKLQNDLQEENNKLLKEILKVLLKK